MPAALALFAVVCTVHYFGVLLWRPAMLAAMFAVTSIWKIALVGLYRTGVAIGIAGMIFLGLKEVWCFVMGYRLGVSYDEYIGVGAVVVTIVLLRGFERTARVLAAHA